MESGRPFGAISIYSNETNPWSSEEVELLRQLADDISLGVLSIREREARRRAEEELRATNEELMATEGELKVASEITQEYANRLEDMVDERTAKLRLSEERLRAFMESTDEGFAIYDSQLRLLDLNRVALGWLLMKSPPGTVKGDIIGKRVLELLPGIEKTELYAAFEKVLRTGDPRQFEGVDFVSLDIWMLSSVFRVGSGLGVISRDISRRKRLQEALKRAEVVAAVEQMGATIAHDLRGPLGMIVQAVNLIKQDPSITPRMLQLVEENATRSLKMIADWRSSTRQIVPQPTKTDLDGLIKRVLDGAPIPSNVEVVTSQDEGLDSVFIDPDIMHRIIDNLVRNAFEAMPQGGRLSVKTEKGIDQVVIRVCDTGIGIPDESRERIFSPLYTTKSGGMGLGLTYCRRAVEAMSGSIEFESRAGAGATFIVRLPLTPNKGYAHVTI
jgi:signal transduction histidine kinase